jgi:uncharacterized phage-associated protein
MVRFAFDADKTLAAAIYIAGKNLPELTMGKLFKLLFLAEKDHLVRYGRPITGDWYAAMKNGPVPSNLYNLFKELKLTPTSDAARRLAESISIDASVYEYPRLTARVDPDPMQLSQSDVLSIDRIVNECGHLTFLQLRSLTHETPAYENAWQQKPEGRDSEPILFEDFFEEDPNALSGAKEEMLENYRLRVNVERLSTI